MALSFTWAQFIERIIRHINNNFPNENFSTSDNEVYLYINEAMAYGLVGQVWSNAKITGQIEVPDGYIVQFALPALTQDAVSGKWVTTLPQPPLSLALGYSINRIYPATAGFGQGQDVILLKPKRVGRRNNMPMQFGVYGYVTNARLWLYTSNGSSLLGQTFYAEMPSTRATSLSDPMNLPDDAAKILFDLVIARLLQRLQVPQDVIDDSLPAGNKTS